ncbi:MAG: DUF72 domain-containing protein, partial [Proteobacteria bacterium]
MRWLVGTSGFGYDEWSGSFYPDDLPGAQRLRFYAERLPAVEINQTFRQMPRAALLARWAERVPPGFRFALKAPRRISHAGQGADVDGPLAHLFEVAGALGEARGPVLIQLPPWARRDVDRLRRLLRAAPPEQALAFEFRHASWQDAQVYDALRAANAALCIADGDGGAPAAPLVATARFGYLRLRAPAYDDAALGAWCDAIRAQGWDEAFVFFKHEAAGAAPALAARLLAIATGAAPGPPAA